MRSRPSSSWFALLLVVADGVQTSSPQLDRRPLEVAMLTESLPYL